MTRRLTEMYLFIDHYDLILWFSDFALYLNTQWVYDHISFTLPVSMTRPMTLKYLQVSVTLFHGSVILYFISFTQLAYEHASFTK